MTNTVSLTPQGWPYLADDAEMWIYPQYTRDIATKLESDDAEVAAAINAAQQAQAAAASIQAAAAKLARLPHGTATGMASISVSGTNQSALTVALPAGRFTAAPTIMLTKVGPESGTWENVVDLKVVNRTANNFRFTAQPRVSATATLNVAWLAVQQ